VPAVREIVSVALIFALADHKSVLVGRLPEELFFRFELGVGVGSDKHYDRVGSCWLDSRARLVVRGGSFQRPLKLSNVLGAWSHERLASISALTAHAYDRPLRSHPLNTL